MKKLPKDEAYDQRSYLHKILAQKYGARADSFRYEAYSTRSTVNGLFAKALKFKETAYHLESKTNNAKDKVWKKIYTLKRDAFRLETKANTLNGRCYQLKKLFYTYAEKEAKEHALFTKLKSMNYATKVRNNVLGECGSRAPEKK
jgi:predicted nuclease with TOPRIM domain